MAPVLPAELLTARSAPKKKLAIHVLMDIGQTIRPFLQDILVIYAWPTASVVKMGLLVINASLTISITMLPRSV